jgi:predicted permease
MREWLSRITDWFRRERLTNELGEEITFHRRQLEEEASAERAGEPAWEARRRMGNLTRAVEESRERWSVPWLDHLQQDVRYALRGLRRSPAFTFGVVATLALGIGANAAMFGVVDRLMFRPYPMLRDPATAHRVYLQWSRRESQFTAVWMQYTRYVDLQRASTSFSNTAAFFPLNRAVGVGDATRERPVAAVSATYFDFFDAPPVLGRYFTPDEDRTPMGATVAVLSHGFWQSEFGGRNVLGETIQVDNLPLTIIGVAPRAFTGVTEGSPRALFFPITAFAGGRTGNDATEYYTRYNWGWMEAMVRRKPEVSVAQASADLTNAFIQSWNREREMNPSVASVEVARPHAIVGPLKTAAGPDAALEARTALWVSGVALIVLLIACANVANLFLGRALRRRREVALRLALGVRRGRLAAQMMTESVILALVGLAVAVPVAQWGGSVMSHLYLPEGVTFSLFTDGRTLGVAALVSLGAALLTGLAPAIIATKADLANSLKAGAREGTYHRSRTRTALLVAQGALSVVLLVGAGLFVRSLDRVRSMRLGYDAEQILFVRQALRGLQLDDSAAVALRRSLLEAAAAIPGVEHVAAMSSVPFWSTSTTDLYVAEIDSVQRLGQFTYQTATPDYFATLGTRILRGRAFGPDDRAGAPRVAVVSEGMARVLWPGRDAIGQCMRVSADTMPCTMVIGIAEDAVQTSLTDSRRYRYYLPLDQYRPANGWAIMVRTRGEPANYTEAVRKALQPLMPGAAYVAAQPLNSLIDPRRRSWEMGATMFVAFGGLALVVAAIGLYAVIGYNVAQRMHELGVRIALGARSPDVVRLVVGQGVGFAIAGVVCGGALAVLAGRFVQPLLFEQSATDPTVFLIVAAVLVLVAGMASSVPAMRATRADPNRTLRAE